MLNEILCFFLAFIIFRLFWITDTNYAVGTLIYNIYSNAFNVHTTFRKKNTFTNIVINIMNNIIEILFLTFIIIIINTIIYC